MNERHRDAASKFISASLRLILSASLFVKVLQWASPAIGQVAVQDILVEAAAWMKTGDFQSALETYKKAIESAPGDWRGYQGAGNACSKLEDYTGALTNYKDALRLKEGGDPKLEARISELEALAAPANPAEEEPSASQEIQAAEVDEAPPMKPGDLRQARRGGSASHFSVWLRLGSFLRLSQEFETSAKTSVSEYEDPNFFYPGTTASYKVSTARTGFGLSTDLGYQAAPSWVLGFRLGYQNLPDAFLDHFSESDAFSSTVYDDALHLSVVHLGVFVQAQKPGPKWTLYGRLVPGLYIARIRELEEAYFVPTDSFRFSAAVQGSGFGASFQAGAERRLGRRVALFAEASFETAVISSLTGRWSYSDSWSGSDSGMAVWALLKRPEGDLYTILDKDVLSLAGAKTAGIGLSSLRLDLGLRGGW